MVDNKILNHKLEYDTNWDEDCVYDGIIIDPSNSKVYSKRKWVDDGMEYDLLLFACPIYISLKDKQGIVIHSVWKSELFDSVFEINGALMDLRDILIGYGLVHCDDSRLYMLLSCILNCFVELGFTVPLQGLGRNILK